MVTYPKDWKIFDLGDILEFKNGLNKGKAYFGHGTPIVNYMDVYKKNGLRSNDINGAVSLSRDEIRRFEAKKNDVFFTRTSETPEEVGISAVLLDEIPNCVFSGFVLRGRPKMEGLSPEYCQYCFGTKEFRNEIIKHCTYTTRALTNGKVLSAIKIPLPPLVEQKAIATTLSSFDAHIDNLTALIEKKKAIRDGALADLMSGRTRLAGFSGEWEETTLGAIGTFIKGAPLSKAHISTCGNPFILYGELYTTYKEVTYEVFRRTQKKVDDVYYSQVGDVIIPTSGETAEEIATACCVMVSGAILAGDLNIYRAEAMDGRFISHTINHVINRQISEVAQGISVVHIKASELGKIKILLPLLAEQKAIADILTSMDTEIQNLEAERDKMQAIRAGAMDDLLTGRVRLPM